jgi:Pectate lyase superfamily protein
MRRTQRRFARALAAIGVVAAVSVAPPALFALSGSETKGVVSTRRSAERSKTKVAPKSKVAKTKQSISKTVNTQASSPKAVPFGSVSGADVSLVEGGVGMIVFSSISAPTSDIQFRVVAGVGTAQLDDRGTGLDLTVSSNAIWKVDALSVVVEVRTRNDDIRELDEGRVVSLVRNDTGTVVASATVTIVDDDRKTILDIRATGARGDGVTDDTVAIQSAIDQAAAAGGGVIIFPPGTYIVTSVNIRPGLTFIGQGGVIKRPANQGKWVRTFTTDGYPYKGDGPSEPLVLEGMIFDGNRQHQGEYHNYELEQAHLLMLYAAADSPGQLRVYVDRSAFHDGVGDGISAFTNVNLSVTDVVATNVFRGGLVVGGGNTDVSVDGLTTTSTDLPTGVDFEVDGPGYQGSYAVRATLSNLDIDADFDLGTAEKSVGSSIAVDHLVMHKPPFTSFTPNAKVLITNSVLQFGGSDLANRMVFPSDMTIQDSRIFVTADSTEPFAAVDVWFGHQSFAELPPGVLRFRNVAFSRNPGSGSATFGVYRRVVRPTDQILFENVTFDPRLSKSVGP